MNAEPVRVVVEVAAGVLPGTPEPEFTRRWAVTSAEWAERGFDALLEMNGKAAAYAIYLQCQPDTLNWVRTDWLWM